MAQAASHWAEERERGAAWGPALLAGVYRLLGRSVCIAVMAPVVTYFFLTGAKQRRASRDYLRRVWAFTGRRGRPGLWHSLLHFLAFGVSLVDRFGAWISKIDRDDIDAIDSPDFEAMRDDARGALILSAHFGATEVIRAVASRHQQRRIMIVIHSPHAAQYGAIFKRFAKEGRVRLLQASSFDVGSAVEISAAVERGEWVVMMGDRLPVRRDGRMMLAPLLGAPAPFPQGPFILAAALRCPIYTLFCYRAGARYRVHVARLSDGVAAPRGQRASALKALVVNYARALEVLLVEAPYQWFNFYDYWTWDGDAGGTVSGDEN